MEEEKMKSQAIPGGTAVKIAKAKCNALSDVGDYYKKPHIPFSLIHQPIVLNPEVTPRMSTCRCPLVIRLELILNQVCNGMMTIL